MTIRRRIGSTNYEVSIQFNLDSKETINDKIMRLVRHDAQTSNSEYDIIKKLQVGQLPERGSQ